MSLGIALLHVAIVFIGPPAYRYFDAGERIVQLAEAGSWQPAMLTLCVAVIFAVFSLYAFSGARAVRRLPLLRTGLLFIAAIYILRGSFLIPEVMRAVGSPGSILPRQLVFSSVSLLSGLLYLAGTIASWHCLKPLGRYQ